MREQVDPDSDPLAFWQSLRSYPSLIGAHLVELRELSRYESALIDALRNLEVDLNNLPPENRDLAESELRRAVEMVTEARKMIYDAQYIIVEHFST